jgi:branched-chain amino acid transport system substrate-binding protein
MRRLFLATAALLVVLCCGAQAADQIKLGLQMSLSGSLSPPGQEGKRGMDLALEELGYKFGRVPVKVTIRDDKSSPAEAVQAASKLIDETKVDFVTGLTGSNTLNPVFKTFTNAGIFTIGALAGPVEYAGKDCSPNGFFVALQTADWASAVGKYMSDKGIKSAAFVGADYQGGYEHVEAAIKAFRGKVVGPIYTPLPQLDFASEIARIRAEKPEAVYVFLVGPGGIAFVKQYAQAGMTKQIPLYVEDPVANPLTFPAQGDAALDMVVSTAWYAGIDNPANRKFVAAFVAKYGREPASFAAIGYDAIKLIDSAVRAVDGKIENKDAVRAALRRADFESVRGKFKFNNNHYPIQNVYLGAVTKDEHGRQMITKSVVLADWQDGYHQQCPMKW